MEMTAQQKKALEMVKAVVDDGIATINGTDYEFTKTTHKKRRKVFAFFTKVAAQLQAGNYSFLDSDEWDAVEALLCEIVTVEGVQLSKRADYWENHESDYLPFVTTALPVVCYPFLKGSATS